MRRGMMVPVVLFAAVLWAGSAFGAGFALIEQSVSGLGTAFSGGSAAALDATTVFFNPAGMTRLEGTQAVAGLHLISPRTEFKDSGESSVSLALGGGALTGKDGGKAGEAGFAPNFYVTQQLSNGFVVGLGVNAPFGLATDYDEDWKGRYHAQRSDVYTININPCVAYKVNDQLSVGAGFNAQYIEAELTNAIDFGSIAYAQSGLNPGLAGLVQNADGRAKLEANDWGYGYNFGILYEFNPGTRIGASYRSRIRYTLDGDAKFNVPSVISGIPAIDGGIAAMFANTGAQADIDLPDNASLSVYHEINDQWAVMADVTWTNWSLFKELRVQFDENPNGLTMDDNVTTENWDDNWRYSVGASYQYSPNLILRAGVAYDQTPIPDAEHRTPRIPGEDRIWTAIGFGYQLCGHSSIDFGYAHLFVSDSDIDKQAGVDPAGENFFRGTLVGEFENSVDIASVQLTTNF